MKQVALGFGLLILAVLVLFQLAKFSRFQWDFDWEIWLAAFSIIFLLIGIFLSRKLFAPKPRIIEKEIIIVNDVMSNANIDQGLLTDQVSWTESSATYRGDSRALDATDWAMINNRNFNRGLSKADVMNSLMDFVIEWYDQRRPKAGEHG